MDTTREDEIRAVETRFWNAMRDKDGRIAAELTDEGCIVVGAQGVSAIGRAAMEKMTGDTKWTLKTFAFDEQTMQIRFVNHDTALVGYHVHEELEVDGKALTLEAHDASVWLRRADGWRCALHTEAVAGDPFGR